MTFISQVPVRRLKVLFQLCLLLVSSSMGYGQQVESRSHGIPYRRVFVPSKDLDAIGMDEFRPIDVHRLEELLQAFSKVGLADATSDNLTDSAGRIQLQSMYYVAKLVGADLLSERSQMTLVGTPRPGERFTLRPWSLAVQLPPGLGARSEMQPQPTWIYDAKGSPQIAVNSSELAGDTDGAKQRNFSLPFGWSARANLASTPDNLKFSFEVPRCANCCLVLALPPQAVIENSLTVVRRVGEWAEIDRRLSDWKNFAKESTREQSTSRTTESLWLIELGGSSIASFSIALGGGNRSKDDSASVDSTRYVQLIQSQSNEHYVEGPEMRTTCEAEIFASQELPWMRMNLEEGARLRRLTVNQQEVEWEVDNGWIRWNMGSVFQGALAAKPASIFAEFISPLPPDRLARLSMPRIAFERGYVMSGTTVVHCESPWRITNAESESSRISEPAGDTKPDVTRMEYSWYASPPSLTIGVERSIPSKRCEVFTRLTNNRQATSAMVRAKFYFAEQDTSQIKLWIAEGWSLAGVHSLDPNDPVAIQTEIESHEPAGKVQLNWGHVQKNRVADIELRLIRSENDSAGKPRRLERQPIFQVQDWKRTDTLIVQDDGMFELKLRDALLDLMISDELIPEWQRSLLPKVGAYYVFRFESHELDHLAFSNLENTNMEQNANLAALQGMEWDEKRSRIEASIKTEVDRTSLNALRVKHEIQLGFNAHGNEPVSIYLPSDNVLWRLKEGDRWIPLLPVETSPSLSNSASGMWQFDLSQIDSECTLLAVINSEIKDGKNVDFRMPVPLNADVRLQQARSTASDVTIHCEDTDAYWEIDDMGFKFLNLTALDPDRALFAKVLEKSQDRRWIVNERELHVAIDEFGSQRASIFIRSSSMPNGAIGIELDEGWHPSAVLARRPSKIEVVPFRIDGRRLVISPNQLDEGETELQIDMTGDRLRSRYSLVTMDQNFQFKWPEFLDDVICLRHRQYLWLPAELQLAEWDRAMRENDQESWPMWRWSRQVATSLFDLATQDRSRPAIFPSEATKFSLGKSTRASIDSRMGQMVPSNVESFVSTGGLFANMASDGWRVASEVSSATDAFSNEKKNDRRKYRIARVDAGSSFFAILFALVTLATPRLILFRHHAAALFALFLIVCSHFAPAEINRFAYTALVGMSTGFLVFGIYRLLSRPANNERMDSQRNSARLSPWGDRGGESESIPSHGQPIKDSMTSVANLGSLGLCLSFGWGVTSFVSPLGSAAFGNNKPDDLRSAVYQIVIPMDDAGNMAGTNAYVPKDMLELLNGKMDRTRLAEPGTHLLSARYSLRVGTRRRVFNSSDQITMVYEFLVGDDLESFRFPVNATQLLLPRFSVDGNELNLGSKLRSTGSQWIWTPDKPGRHTVQIIAQPELKSNESDRSRESLTQQLDIALIPVANASIEIETDPQNRIEIVSQGRVTDPAAGRFVAMLGALDRLQCSVIVPISKPSGVFSTPATAVPESGEVPVMHTELFLQNDILQAKTILDFPRGVPSSPTIEIEADLQWQPVGTQWGDARWVESRPGSTLSRRRYLLEWKGTQGNSIPGSSSARDRQISVVWVPLSTTQSLNVLFAECRDRRARRGTLRYSRSPGSNWSIEGINTWIPAIGSKDRLDWPELKTHPIATGLRIPSNGGFGRLNHKTLADRQQARVTTKWLVEQNRETLTSHIELLGGSTSSDTLVLDLPSDFHVTELRNRIGPIRYLQSKSNGRLHVQVLAERRIFEASDLWIQAKRQPASPTEQAIKVDWLEIPWIALPTSINADQTMEIIVSEHVVLRFESEPSLVFGKGLKVPVLNLTKSYSDLHANTLAASRYQLLQRRDPITGKITVKRNSDSLQREMEVVGELSRTATSRPYYILEVPVSLKDRWQSEMRISVIPCPDSTKAWLQIPVPEPPTLDAENQVTTLVRFIPRSEEPLNDAQLMSRIRALDRDLIPTHEIASTVQDANDEPSTLTPPIIKCILRVCDTHFLDTPTARCALLDSQYWIEEAQGPQTANRELEWRLGDDVEVVSILINGNPVAFEQDGRRIICPLIQAGLSSDVHVLSKHKAETKSDGMTIIDAPEMIGYPLSADTLVIDAPQVVVMLHGKPIAMTKEPDAIRAITESCLEKIESNSKIWPNFDRIEFGSDLDQWKRHWTQMAHRYLLEWSKTAEPSQQEAFGLAVDRWHSLHTPVLPTFNVGCSLTVRQLPASAIDSRRVNKWYSLFGCLLTLVTINWLAPPLVAILFQRPWWSLMGLGLFAWLVCGSVIPILVLGLFGLVVAVDSYWLLTSQLRRTGTRGLRSL